MGTESTLFVKFRRFRPPTTIVAPSGMVTWLWTESLLRGGGRVAPPWVTAGPVKLLRETEYSSCR